MPFTFYPEYEHTIKFLETEATDVHWTINAPALIVKGPVSISISLETIDPPADCSRPFPPAPVPIPLATSCCPRHLTRADSTAQRPARRVDHYPALVDAALPVDAIPPPRPGLEHHVQLVLSADHFRVAWRVHDRQPGLRRASEGQAGRRAGRSEGCTSVIDIRAHIAVPT